MDTARTPRGSRLRRWLIALAAVLLLLAVYGIVLDRFAQRLGADIEKSMRAEPGVEDQKHRAN